MVIGIVYTRRFHMTAIPHMHGSYSGVVVLAKIGVHHFVPRELPALLYAFNILHIDFIIIVTRFGIG